MVNAPIVAIKGPYDENGNQQGPATNLYLGEDANANTDTETNKKDIPGLDSEESLLAPLQGQVEFSHNGSFNAHRLFNAGLDSTVEDSLYRWLFQLETLVLPQQGIGYELLDNATGFNLDPNTDIGVLVEEAEWEVTGGEGLTGDWRLDLVFAEGIQPAKVSGRTDAIQDRFDKQQAITRSIINYDNQAFNLGTVEEFGYTRSVDIDANKLIHNFDVPQVGVVESGVKSEIRLSGRVIADQINQSLADWVNELNTSLHGTEITLSEAYTKREFQGAVSTTNGTINEGQPNVAEYDIEIDIGTVQV